MRALQFATATVNLASQNAFLFLATHGPNFIASSSSATLLIKSSVDSSTVAVRRRSVRIPYHAAGIGVCTCQFSSESSLQIWPLPVHSTRKFGLRRDSPCALACTGTRVADCSLVHYAHVKGHSFKFRTDGAPPDLPICALALAFKFRRNVNAHKVASAGHQMTWPRRLPVSLRISSRT